MPDSSLSAAFAREERALLEDIAQGQPLAESLAAIIALVERQAEGMFCSILLLEPDGKTVRLGASRSLPPAFAKAFDGQLIGPTAGSCGTALHRKERVIVEDVATHPYWAAYKDVALAYGLRACWSSPIFDAQRGVLGSFAMYYREIRGPSPEELLWVDVATHLASISICRERADLQLRRSQTLLSLVYNNVEDVIFYVAIEGENRYRVLSVNPAFERITGTPGEAIVGRLITEVMHAETLDITLEKYRTAIATGQKVTWEHAAIYPKGEKIGEVTLCPVFDSAGVCTNIVSTVHDVTARRHAEREREELQAKAMHAQRLQALGTLAGGIAHDFNNVLSIILSYAEILRLELKPDEPLGEDVDEIRKAAVRATEMTRQLLAFSRQQMLQARVLEPNQAIRGMARMLRRLIGTDIELTVLTAPKVPNIRVDPTQLEQILMNLAINARDAMPTGGKLTIETEDVTLDDDYARHHPGATPGRYVMLAVSDTGVGMDRATQERIFEPFFTTKEKGKGTGLGLATVFGIVKQSGGNIWIYSEPGRGATFRIYLPAVDAPVEEPGQSDDTTVPLTGKETILLVEDDEQVRMLATTILRGAGYRVLDAANAGEAILICEQHGAKIDLLLTDVVMPRMSGRQLAERLLPMRPQLKILYMSGYTDDAIFHHGLLDSGVHYLQKPITPSSLLQKVRVTLDHVSSARH